jgi:DNA-binding NtrC family response regulator
MLAWSMENELKSQGAETLRANSLQQALARLPGFGADLAIVDVNLPDGNGLELLRKWRREYPNLPVIMITAHPAVDNAITALRLGAFDFLRKPFDLKDLQAAAKRAAEVSRLRQTVRQYEGGEVKRQPLTMVGNSECMQAVQRSLQRIAASKVDTVLVQGESGTGKELAARALHEWSKHAGDPFVEINCASIPENLLESELFGFEKGAFTDARERKLGLFEVARNGTVFLDEVGELPLKLQAKLLRVLEYRRFRRLGGTKDIDFRGRIVAATNRNLQIEVAAERFRLDLYHRLNIISIELPPLRDRREDIPALASFMLGQISNALEVDKPQMSKEAFSALMLHHWPGNIRELKNVLQRAVVLHEPKVIEPQHLDLQAESQSLKAFPTSSEAPAPAVNGAAATSTIIREVPIYINQTPATPAEPASPLDSFKLPKSGISLEDVERTLLVQALDRAHNNQTKAATLLGLSRHTFRYRLEKFGLLNQAAEGTE